jgi:hypothetical protein
MLATVVPPNEQQVVPWHPDPYAFTEHVPVPARATPAAC